MDKSKPYVICHMMSTIEGKIASGEEKDILNDYFDLYQNTEDILESKAWIVGRVTMEMFAEGKNTQLSTTNKNIDEADFLAPFNGEHFLFAIDTKGILRWKDNTITFGNVKEKLHLVVVVTKKTSKDYLNYLQEKNVSYVMAGDEEVNFIDLLERIKEKFKVDKLLLEGGGLMNGSLMSEGLIDEISLLLCPIVINRTTAPSVFERKIQEEVTTKKYQLVEFKKIEKDTLWLRYRKN